MRKILLLAVVFATTLTAFGQDFSNKGKEFWLCFPTHVPSSNNATLSIYITGDKASSGTITMPNGAFSGVFSIAANGIQEIQIPWAANRHINGATESNTVLNKSIHIKTNSGQPPVVAYAQQWAGARSAATLLLPVNVLGTKYYSMNFAQDGVGGGMSQFQVIATKDNTVIEITPVKNGLKQSKITVNLPLAGDLYQYWSTDPAAASQDLTGTFIESVASGMGGCKPIAVSSGSSNIKFGTSTCNSSNSYDPLWQQLYPVTTWGKNFGFIPFADYLVRGNPYRVLASEDNTSVYFDGTLVATLNAGQIYPAAFTALPVTLLNPTSITADKPICVSQYAQSDACSGQPGPAASRVGDPDMVILNPIEQNISDITVFSSTNQSITRQYANVLMKTIAIPSFRISRNGGPLTPPTGSWQTFATLPGYSYLRETLTGANSVRMRADSGFNAIAYGWGNVESYAYSAGTNVKDLYQQILVQTQYGIETTPSVCTNTPFRFKVSLPYCADSLRWDLSALPGPPIPSIVTESYTTCTPGPGGPDSITFVNAVPIYWYSIPTLYSFSSIGTYPVSITVYAPNSSGCGSEQLIDFDLQISDPPAASFSKNTPGCYLEPVVVTETTPQLPKPTYRQWWEFYDPVTNVTTIYTNAPPYPPNTPGAIRSVSHLFTTPGVKRIRYASITTPGCLSDTIVQTVTLPDKPFATAAGNITTCINTGNQPVTFTGTDGTAEYYFNYTIDNGSGPGPVLTTPFPSTGGNFVTTAATNVAGTFIYNLVGVTNAIPLGTPCTRAITGQSVTITVLPDHAIAAGGGNPNQTVCVNNAITPFTLTLSGGATNIAAPVGLPGGVTANAVGNTVTISGTPNLAGSYPYSITTTGNACLTATFNGTITVNADHTISLTSGATSQAICINTAIAPITLSLGGGATGITPAGLPPGVTAIVTGTTVTISGMPTSVAGSPYNYSITTTGNSCLTANITGTITVNPDHTIAFGGGNPNPVLCVNTVMPSFTLTIGGGATNIAAPVNLPPGVTATVAGNTVTISGTPTSPGTYNYGITTSGNACLTATYNNTITVNDDATIALTSAVGTDNQTKCINNAITDIDYLVAGGGTGATIVWTPGVPAGINFNSLGGGNFRITGTPTATGTYNYTINTTGPCIKPTATGTITVNPDHTIAFAAGNPNPTVCVNTVMPSFTLTLGGGATNILPASGLPLGVTATVAGNTVTIAGTPSLAGSYPYSITTSGNACVTATYTNTINVTADATISLVSGSTSQAVCRNTAIADINYAIGGSATGATISWSPSTPTGITFTPVGPTGYKISGTPTVVGTQIYTYTISTAGPCVKPTETGTVTVNALPIAAFTVPPPACANNNVLFTNTSTPNAAGTTAWAWDFGDANANAGNPNTSTAQTPSHYYILPGSYTATLNVTNSNSCISNPIASVTFIVNDTPRAGFIVPDVCINDVATVFADTSKISVGTINRPQNQWNYGDPGSGPLDNSVGVNGSHLYPAPGNYLVTQIVTSALGCKDTITLPITINSADPVSAFTPTNSCSSDSVELLNQSTVGFGNVTRLEIQWDFVGNPAAVQTVIAPAFNGIYRHKYPTLQTTQNYTVRMTAYSGVICSNASSKTVTVYATPVATFASPQATCLLRAPFQLVASGSPAGGTVNYAGPGVSSTGIFDPQSVGIGTYAIKFTYTLPGPGGCFDTLTRFITVRDTAHAKFSVVLPACEQTPVSFTDLSTAPSSVTLASTVWNFGDGTGTFNFPAGSTFTHTFAIPGTPTVTMHTVSDAATGGCLSTDTMAVVSIDANQHIALTSSNNTQTLCVNNPIAQIRYQLSGGANNIVIPAVGLPPGVTPAVTGNVVTLDGVPTLAGTYNYTLRTLGNTCQDETVSGVIIVKPDDIITLNAASTGNDDQSVCVNTAIKNIVFDLGGEATGYTSIVPPLPTGVVANVSGNQLIISGVPSTTTGGPNYSITTNGSCVRATANFKIAVHPYPVPDFAFDKTSYCIPNAYVGFINNTTPIGNNTYEWTFDDGGTSTSPTPPPHHYLTAGPFNVVLKARSNDVLNDGVIGCVTSSPPKLLDFIHEQPKAGFVLSKPAICIGAEVTITDSTDNKGGLGKDYNWDFGDGTTDFFQNAVVTHQYRDTITYIITYFTVNSFGCNSDTINVLPLTGAPYKPFSVNAFPTVNAGRDLFVLEGGSVELEATAYAKEPSYSWSPAQYLTDSKILRPRVVSPATDMTYILTVTGRGGCPISDAVFVKLLKFPTISNTFTPNGDGQHEKWDIPFLNTYPDNRVQIFTRTGKLIFESRGYNTPWDGTFKGKPMPFDTYYYIIEPGNGRDPITGYVTILK